MYTIGKISSPLNRHSMTRWKKREKRELQKPTLEKLYGSEVDAYEITISAAEAAEAAKATVHASQYASRPVS